MRLIHPTYYAETTDTDYPFESGVSRSNQQVTIDPDVFVDGRLFPPDGRADLFLASIDVGPAITLTLADGRGVVGAGTFPRDDVPEFVTFYTPNGAYIGLLQGYPPFGLRKLTGWSNGVHNFTAAQTRFAATVVAPQPQETVRSVRLESGAVFFGDVILVGERGVQLTMRRAREAQSSSSGPGVWQYASDIVRIDVVGDPLFKRRACDDENLEPPSPVYLQGVVFEGNTIRPDVEGGLQIALATSGDEDQPALRVAQETNGLRIEFVG